MRTDLIWRAVLPTAALVALPLDAPQGVAGGLALVGLAVTAARLTALRSSGTADRVLVGVGGILVVLVLAGMVLGSTAIGLSSTSWVVAVAALSGLGLLVAAALPARETAPPPPPDTSTRRRVLQLSPWVALAAVVVVTSVQLSASSLAESEQPPVQMSLGRISNTEIQVVVTSGSAVGPLELRTAGDGDELSYPLITIPENGSVTTTVSLPRTGRFVISLSYPDQSKPLRTLLLDR